MRSYGRRRTYFATAVAGTHGDIQGIFETKAYLCLRYIYIVEHDVEDRLGLSTLEHKGCLLHIVTLVKLHAFYQYIARALWVYSDVVHQFSIITQIAADDVLALQQMHTPERRVGNANHGIILLLRGKLQCGALLQFDIDIAGQHDRSLNIIGTRGNHNFCSLHGRSLPDGLGKGSPAVSLSIVLRMQDILLPRDLF